jgi:hypothetical protein
MTGPALPPAGAVARRLGRCPSWFRGERRSALERAGFPPRDALLGGWHAAAVEAWLARRSGVEAPSADAWLAALNDRAA